MRRSKVTLLFSLTFSVDFFMIMLSPYRPYNKPAFLQPRTKPVETNRENAYFYLSSRQKLKPPPNECPIFPLPLSKVV